MSATEFPPVVGYCPACSDQGLFLGAGGHVTCSRLDCPDPGAAGARLARPAPPGRPELAELRALPRGERRARLLDLLWDAAAAGTIDDLPGWVEGALLLVGAETVDTLTTVVESFLLPTSLSDQMPVPPSRPSPTETSS